MFNVFKGALLALVREKSVFIWSLAFPLILSTMFVFMFANLDEAGQSGFGSIATFNRVFQQYEGMSPSAYRKSGAAQSKG